MTAPAEKRCAYFKAYSRRDEIVRWAPSAWEEYRRNFKCSVCFSPRPEWDEQLTPIHVVVDQEPRGCVVGVAYGAQLIHRELYDNLSSYIRGAVVTDARTQGPSGATREIPYVACWVPRHLALEAERGQYCRHAQCRGCGRFGNKVGWASGAIVRRYLDDRRVYFDDLGNLLVESALLDQLNLRARFPDLRPYRVEVIPEPLDGDVLPGDPGWTGVFVERPLPDVPKDEPKPGRWTLE